MCEVLHLTACKTDQVDNHWEACLRLHYRLEATHGHALTVTHARARTHTRTHTQSNGGWHRLTEPGVLHVLKKSKQEQECRSMHSQILVIMGSHVIDF